MTTINITKSGNTPFDNRILPPKLTDFVADGSNFEVRNSTTLKRFESNNLTLRNGDSYVTLEGKFLLTEVSAASYDTVNYNGKNYKVDIHAGAIGKYRPQIESVTYHNGATDETVKYDFATRNINGVALSNTKSIADVMYAISNQSNDMWNSFMYNKTIPTTIFGSQFDDQITGHWYSDFIYGNGGKDNISGGDYHDRLWGDNLNNTHANDSNSISGGAGFDTIYGGSGSDLIYGGADNDLIYGDNLLALGAGSSDTIYGDSGTDTIYAGLGDDLVWGGTENDLIYGNEGNDIIDGGAGNDKIYGGLGSDTIYGGDGSDFIFAGELGGNASQDTADTIFDGAGNDTVQAGFGDDIIYIGTGNDVIKGEHGDDQFYFTYKNFGNDSITGGFKADKPVYTVGTDKIFFDTDVIASWNVLKSEMKQVGGNVIITDDDGTITLVGVKLADLDASDFRFGDYAL